MHRLAIVPQSLLRDRRNLSLFVIANPLNGCGQNFLGFNLVWKIEYFLSCARIKTGTNL
jgi:hypothetical protein